MAVVLNSVEQVAQSACHEQCYARQKNGALITSAVSHNSDECDNAHDPNSEQPKPNIAGQSRPDAEGDSGILCIHQMYEVVDQTQRWGMLQPVTSEVFGELITSY